MSSRLFIIFLLGFSSGLPLALVGSTLQAWFAESGQSVLYTSSLSLLGLPYLYRTLWAPFLDRYHLRFLGRRRGFMFMSQIGLIIGFNAMYFLTPQHHSLLLMGLALVLAFLSATQDMAIDAHRIEYLPQKLHGLGATVASSAYRMALLVSGGVALIIAAHRGWGFTYALMGCLLFIGLITTLISKEPSVAVEKTGHFYLKEPLMALYQRPKIFVFIFFILLYKSGEAFTASTSGIVMPFLIQGLGFSLDAIGYVHKIMGIIALIMGGLVSGVILVRVSLYKAVFLFGLLQACANVLFIALALVGKNMALFITAVWMDNFAAGMTSTALAALLMQFVDKRYTATQFSFLIALTTLPRIVSGPFAGFIQLFAGWVGVYEVAFILSLGFIPFLMYLKKDMGCVFFSFSKLSEV